jgi:N4-gp56 family major capsid protein
MTSNGSTNIGTAPILPSYWAICHPTSRTTSPASPASSRWRSMPGQTATVEGEFGYYGRAGRGVRFVMSEDASIDADAGATLRAPTCADGGFTDTDIYTICIYGQDAFGSVGLGKKHTDGVYRPATTTGAWE